MEQLHAQFYNGTQIDFGKNRVQYDDFQWQFYRFPKFETYFYTGGKDLAVHAAKYVNVRMPELEKFFDYQVGEKVQLIIYNKQSHYRQSNIGLTTNVNQNIGGVTKIVGSKLFVYFEGDYEKFEKQIDAGLLEVMINQLVFGGNWREVLRNSALVDIPEWYIKGLISYLTYPNDPLVNAKIKDGILNDRFGNFNSLSGQEAIVAGHALWQYIDETYGSDVIPNILYMTRVAREIDDGFLYVIGVPFAQLYKEWILYYQAEFLDDKEVDSLGSKLPIKGRKNRRYQNFKVSREGEYLAYSTNQMGKYKIYYYDNATKKTKKVFQDEHKLERIQDYSYPILEWHPSGKYLTFITEDKGALLFHTYDLETEELSRKPIFKMEKVLSYQYLEDGKQFIFSGVNEGQSDIYIYNVLGNTQKKLTDDIYDDLEPTIDQKRNKVYFVSNRLNDSLNIEHNEDEFAREKDIFVLTLGEENSIQSVTNTDEISETSPILIEDKLNYLTNDKEISNQFYAEYDSAISKIDTVVHFRYFYNTEKVSKYRSPVLSQSATKDGIIYQSTYAKGTFAFYEKQFAENKQVGETIKGEKLSPTIRESITESFLVFEQEEEKLEFDFRNYEFNTSSSESKKNEEKKTATTKKVEEKEVDALEFPTQRLYRLNFRTDNSVLQLNHTFINGQYQLYNGGPFVNSGIGINTKIGIIDLMEDHKVYGGLRYAGELIEYSLSYQNLKHRLDKEYTIMRSRERVSSGSPFIRGGSVIGAPYDIKTVRGVLSLSYPFSEITSLRTVVSVRNDRVIPLSSSLAALETGISNEFYGSLKAAYVYDNTRQLATNILSGTRFRIFGEYYERLYSEGGGASNLQVVGLDFRHYQKIHREMILVGRLAASSSFGKSPLVYYLGGVDEWWEQDKFNRETPIDQTQNYGFQALAANMRGFRQNIRNGNNFVVLNTELRWPVITYFMNRPVDKPFFRDFQLIGFADVGTAWVGKTPYADDNPLNNEVFESGPIRVTYENINDPVVGGVGGGLRSTLLGYFVRVDFAWGIENGIISKKHQTIVSLTLDI